jgi:hypothetical protein
MSAEPAITFLDLTCAIGSDAAHARTLEGNLRQLYRDALLSEFPSGSLAWNAHSNCNRLSSDYLLESIQLDGTLHLAPQCVTITPRQIIELLAEHRWPAADRALDLLTAGDENAAYRLVAEAPLPDGGSKGRLFVESLAVTMSEAWRFCERHTLPIPGVLRQALAAWTIRRKSAFAPDGYAAILDAVTEIREALWPGESCHARAELTAHRSGELLKSYNRHCDNEDGAERLLLHALSDGQLVGIIRVNGDAWTVPQEYWETDSARVRTLTGGMLYAHDSSPIEWQKHRGQPCFIEEVPFRRWLGRKSGSGDRTEALNAVGAHAFDRTYWTYMMVLAWVYFRERPLVEKVADSAVNRRTFYQQERLPDGRIEMVETDVGPMTLLSLTLLGNQRRENSGTVGLTPLMTCAEAHATIWEKLVANTLTAYGLENDVGNLQEIPSLWWADGKVYEDRDGRLYAGPTDVFRTGATRWYGLLFKRHQVLDAWPDMLEDSVKETAAMAGAPLLLKTELTNIGNNRSAKLKQARRGRRPTYEWSAFHAEIARRVGNDPDGFPVVQADLERDMTDWCLEEWGEASCPSESTIREQIAQYYRDAD